MRKTAVLLALALTSVLAPGAGAGVPPTRRAGFVYAMGTFAAAERGPGGGVWVFEQQADRQLSLALMTNDGFMNDIGRAWTDRTAGLAWDDAGAVLWYDAAGVIHQRHEVEGGGAGFFDRAVATFSDTRGMDVGPDRALYVADGDRIRRITSDGFVEPVVGTDGLADVADVAVAADGTLLVLATDQLWRVRDGVRSAVTAPSSGCAATDGCGDGGPASAARLGDASVLDTAGDGTVYVGERATNRIRAIGTDGRIRTVIGGGPSCATAVAAGRSCGFGGPAASASIDQVTSLTVSGPDLFFVTRSGGTGSGQLHRIPEVATRASTAPGYRFVASDGGVFTYGAARFLGSTGDRRLRQPMVGGAAHGDGGYWLVAADGGLFAFGDAPYRGSAANMTTSPVVGMAVTGDGGGYWIVQRNGHGQAFGTADPVPNAEMTDAVGAATVGDLLHVAGRDGRVLRFGQEQAGPIRRRTAAIVGIAATRDGGGWWLVGADGNVYPHGSAGAYGSMVGRRLNAPIVGLTPTPSGRGYWLLGADGGVFSFGDARFLGSTGNLRLNRPIVAVLAG